MSTILSFAARLSAAVSGLLLAGAALAAAVPFNQAAFDKAVAAGEPVVVQFHADWCPTCRAQAPVVAEVLAEPRLKPLKFFVADFDSERELKRTLKVTTQSTFVVFKAGKEVARSTGQTQRAAIEDILGRAL